LGKAADLVEKYSRGPGACGFLRSFSLAVQDVIGSLLRGRSSYDHKLGVALESPDPAIEVCRAVAQGDLLDSSMAGQKRCTHFGA